MCRKLAGADPVTAGYPHVGKVVSFGQNLQEIPQKSDRMIVGQLVLRDSLIVREKRLVRFGAAGTNAADHLTIDRQEGNVCGLQLTLPSDPTGVLDRHAISGISNDRRASQSAACRHERRVVVMPQNLERNSAMANARLSSRRKSSVRGTSILPRGMGEWGKFKKVTPPQPC